jgi:hypothetical protein
MSPFLRPEKFAAIDREKLWRKTTMRFNLIDVLFMVACFTIGSLLGISLSSHLPGYVRLVTATLCGLGIYLAVVCPVYRGLKLYPMVLPRCPCCGNFQDGFYILDDCWPRATYRCPGCEGEFAIWLNGKLGDQETWESPVLALKWPYAFGIYERAKKPK